MGLFQGEREDGYQPGGIEEEGGLLGGRQRKRHHRARHRRRNRSHTTGRLQSHGPRSRKTGRLLRHANRDPQEHAAGDRVGRGPEFAAEHDPHWGVAAGEGRGVVVFEAEDGGVRVGEQAQQVPLICVSFTITYHPIPYHPSSEPHKGNK